MISFRDIYICNTLVGLLSTEELGGVHVEEIKRIVVVDVGNSCRPHGAVVLEALDSGTNGKGLGEQSKQEEHLSSLCVTRR